MILDNPFRLLDLPATASRRDVRQRIDELAVRASMGTDGTLDADTLARIRQVLENPVERLRYELGWLHEDAPPEHATAVRAMERYEKSGGASRHVELWQAVYDSDAFWGYMRWRALAAGDPRATPELVLRLREELPATVLEATAWLAAARVDAAELDRVRRSGFAASAVDGAVSGVLDPLRARLRDGGRSLFDAAMALTELDAGTDAATRALAAGDRLLIEGVLAPAWQLRTLDPSSPGSRLFGVVDGEIDTYRSTSTELTGDQTAGAALAQYTLRMRRQPGDELQSSSAAVAAFHLRAADAAQDGAGSATQVAARLQLAAGATANPAERFRLEEDARRLIYQRGVTSLQLITALNQARGELQNAEDALERRVLIAAAGVKVDRPPAWARGATDEDLGLEPVVVKRSRLHGRRLWATAGAVVALFALVLVISGNTGGGETSARELVLKLVPPDLRLHCGKPAPPTESTPVFGPDDAVTGVVCEDGSLIVEYRVYWQRAERYFRATARSETT